jgi:sulfite exporter TauE/SafE
MCEFALNVGRVLSYTILVAASFSTSIGIYKILLIVNSITIAMYCIGMYFLEKRYSGILSKNDTLAHLKEVENDCENYLQEIHTACYSAGYAAVPV